MTTTERQEVSIQETFSGIVIAVFWWAIGNIHIDMVYNDEGKPAHKTWNPTSHWNEAYHWNSKAAAYKYLRENPDLGELGYQVIDLHDLNWPRSTVPDRKPKE